MKEDARILLVDDQGFNITALKIILKVQFKIDSDQKCDVAMNGEEAVKAVMDDFMKNQSLGKNFSSYKIILMDCQMPFMDGYEATVKIREFIDQQEVCQPIISAVTGHTEQSYIERAINSGMNQVISKPVDIQVLKVLLKKFGYID